MLAHDVDNLADVTNAILQPEPLNGLETGLHVFPNLGANLMNITSPNAGGIVGLPAIANFANPMQFICSSIQAGSRLGYQESAELCAQYLAPILDAIKFNFPPIGINEFVGAMTLPKQISYSEPRLQPQPGYKDTTVPGHLVARHVVLTRQPRAGLGRRTGHAGHRGAAAHRTNISRRSASPSCWAGPTAWSPARHRHSGSTTAGCQARRTPTTRTTRCRRRGTRSRARRRVRHRASSPAIRSAPSRLHLRPLRQPLQHRRAHRCPLKLEGANDRA